MKSYRKYFLSDIIVRSLAVLFIVYVAWEVFSKLALT